MAKPLFDGLMIDLQDVWSFRPSDPEDVHARAELDIKWEGEEGGSVFYFSVATPKGLARAKPLYPTNSILSRSRTVVMSRFDPNELVADVERIIAHAAKPTVEESVQWLMRYYSWEYEDFTQASES